MKTQSISRFLTLLGLTTLLSCGSSSETTNEQADSTQSASTVKVKVEQVTSRDVDQTYEFTGTVEANIKNNISPSIGLRLDDVLVEVGDYVTKGQKLALMDEANLIQSRTQLANYRIEFERVDELYKVGGASKSEWDSRKMAYDVAKTAYQNLEDNTILLSPIDGIVTARNYDDGDMFSQGKPILVVEQITPVKLIINVSESLFKYVKKGMDIKVKLDVYDKEEFNGKISLVYPTVDPQTRTFPVEITIANSDRRVRPGMFARITMSFGVINHVVVPDRAILKQPGSGDKFIYVYKDGKVSYNKVELGRRMDNEYEVVSGVSNGDQVVITGQSRLNNGMQVEVYQ